MSISCPSRCLSKAGAFGDTHLRLQGGCPFSPYEKDYDRKGERIKAFRLVSFWRRLREECVGDAVAPPGELEELARQVWNLGSARHLEV